MKRPGPGINYNPLANVDFKTGIHYGVIPAHDIGQAWYEDSEPQYSTPVEDDADDLPDDAEPEYFSYTADGYQAEQSADSPDIFITRSPYYTFAHYCSPCAPGAGYLRDPFTIPDAYKATAQTLTEISPDTEPELYRDLAEAAGFPRVYCFAADWFADGKAPYRVFSVKTGKEAQP